uniref:Uncharacterized protein n=1 Tax=Anguilla anguilla TaxID=7936 RepID=A0A0E9QF18_ANGAN
MLTSEKQDYDDIMENMYTHEYDCNHKVFLK